MKNASERMFEYISNHISKSDIYSANAIAKLSSMIINYRKSRRMTQKQFAKFMGVTQGMISRWESADYNFTIESIAQICAKLDLSFDLEILPENKFLLSNSAISRNQYARWNIQPCDCDDNAVA